MKRLLTRTAEERNKHAPQPQVRRSFQGHYMHQQDTHPRHTMRAIHGLHQQKKILQALFASFSDILFACDLAAMLKCQPQCAKI